MRYSPPIPLLAFPFGAAHQSSALNFLMPDLCLEKLIHYDYLRSRLSRKNYLHDKKALSLYFIVNL